MRKYRLLAESDEILVGRVRLEAADVEVRAREQLVRRATRQRRATAAHNAAAAAAAAAGSGRGDGGGRRGC